MEITLTTPPSVVRRESNLGIEAEAFDELGE